MREVEGSSAADPRPELSRALTGAELMRWYWLRSELADFARRLGVSTSGGKGELAARIAASLDGEAPPATSVARRRGPSGPQLSGVLTPETVIPPDQRSSQALRRFFEEQLGPAFRFDGAIRAFVHDHPGRTLGDALAHWHATRGAGGSAATEIAPQFELNRFTRQWYADHPGGSRTDLMAAWRLYRATPTDARPRA